MPLVIVAMVMVVNTFAIKREFLIEMMSKNNAIQLFGVIIAHKTEIKS